MTTPEPDPNIVPMKSAQKNPEFSIIDPLTVTHRARIVVQEYAERDGIRRYRDVPGASIRISLGGASKVEEVVDMLRNALEGLQK